MSTFIFQSLVDLLQWTKNKEIIENIKQVELPIEEEVIFSAEEKIAQNIILKDPGGLGFFIFNDG